MASESPLNHILFLPIAESPGRKSNCLCKWNEHRFNSHSPRDVFFSRVSDSRRCSFSPSLSSLSFSHRNGRARARSVRRKLASQQRMWINCPFSLPIIQAINTSATSCYLSSYIHYLVVVLSRWLHTHSLALKRERARRQKIDAAILAAYQVIRQHISLRFISLWPLKRSTRARARERESTWRMLECAARFASLTLNLSLRAQPFIRCGVFASGAITTLNYLE